VATPEPRPGPTQQPDRRQVGVADQAVEQLTEPVGFDRVPAQVGKDESAHMALEGGGGVVAAQDRDGEPVECDQADAAGGLAEGQFATVVLELLAHQQRPVVEVQVAPAQRAGFAAA
jgi:hypothetical protein